MTTLHILILSLIQGITEFLPVSSSGHLVLLPHLFGWQNQGLEMDVALHVGTLTAVFIFGQMFGKWSLILCAIASEDFERRILMTKYD